MDFITVLGIAIGLSMDAFAVSVTNSTIIHDLKPGYGFRMALFFGFFQMIMPIIGWLAGSTFSSYIKNFDHWIAFFLLAFVGGRMIINGWPFKKEKNGTSDDATSCDSNFKSDCRNLPTLFLLSLATSIDALAIGLSFALIKVPIIIPSSIIGLITFLISFAGYFLGRKIGSKIKIELEFFGGLILLVIGTKILLEHLL
ncbi:MAG TPA: manganese efflux pump MntP family protein [Exilispira sp.]|nr:manganese efflux pump MntP family protein [Exilispira sp.]